MTDAKKGSSAEFVGSAVGVLDVLDGARMDSFGFRTYHGLQIALYHTLGALPEPAFTHTFC